MDEKLIHAKDVTESGISEYKLVDIHTDVNGKWGGHRAIVAHFVPIGGDMSSVIGGVDTRQQLMLYALVGNYWEVGLWPGDTHKHSKWQLVKKVVELMDANDVDVIWDIIEQGLLRAELNEVINER